MPVEVKEIEGHKFYIDEAMKNLSGKYDVKAYESPLKTFGDSELERAMGRFMFLAWMHDEFVGVDYRTYSKSFSEEQRYDSANLVLGESSLQALALEAETYDMPLLRLEQVDGVNVYFPTEELAKRMMKWL